MTLIYELSVVYEHYLPAVILFYFIYFYSFIIFVFDMLSVLLTN